MRPYDRDSSIRRFLTERDANQGGVGYRRRPGEPNPVRKFVMSIVEIEIKSVAPATAGTVVWALGVTVLVLRQRIPETAGLVVLLIGIAVIATLE